MLKLFGIIDIVIAFTLFILNFTKLEVIGWVVVGYLIVKSAMYIKSWASIVDLIGAGVVALAIFGHYNLVTWIFVIWFLQKGLISLTA